MNLWIEDIRYTSALWLSKLQRQQDGIKQTYLLLEIVQAKLQRQSMFLAEEIMPFALPSPDNPTERA
jgi:hypothetical protein